MTPVNVLRVTLTAVRLVGLIIAGSWAGNWVLYRLDAPWWTHVLCGFLVGGIVDFFVIRDMIRRRRARVAKALVPDEMWVDPDVVDPMDPRGDGSGLRPGDPMFDHVFAPLMQGRYPHGILVFRSPEGVFEAHVQSGKEGT